MISKQILKLFNKGLKKQYSLQDVVNYSGAKREVVKVILSRLSAQGKIVKLGHGFYGQSLQGIDVEQLACQIVYPAYISFEYALHLHGVLEQVPAAITLATAKKTKTMVLAERAVEYSHLKKELFFGYRTADHVTLAVPEKALLDELYLVGLKKRSINLRELNLDKIDLKKFKKWLQLYPPSTQKLAQSLSW